LRTSWNDRKTKNPPTNMMRARRILLSFMVLFHFRGDRRGNPGLVHAWRGVSVIAPLKKTAGWGNPEC
jgi:hypothetical protein